MINRLVAENTLKVPFAGEAVFGVNKKLLCYQTSKSIKVRPLIKDAKET